MNKGAVWLEKGRQIKRLRRATRELEPGQILHLYYDEKILSQAMQPLTLIQDNIGYSVWYKPSGVLSHGSKWGDHCSVTRWAEKNLKPERTAFLIHRLDKAASGLIMVGHTRSVTTQLCNLFQSRKIEKHYRVVVHGKVEGSWTLTTPVDNKFATSIISSLSYDTGRNMSLLDVCIETGRKHQIRVHMAEAGFPVVGDRLYGNEKDTENLQLFAFSLSFVCPLDKKPVTYTLPHLFLPAFN